VKRSGRGPNNWGAAGEESLDAYAENVNYERSVDNAEAAPVEGEVPAGEAPAQAEATQVKKEEDNTRTLKEYREAQANELAAIQLPPPRDVGKEDTWNNFKVLKKDLNLTLSVIAPTKEKKKAPEATTDAPKADTPTTKPKARGKQTANELLNFKSESRQDNRRRDNREQRADHPRKNQQAASPAASQAPAKIDKNSKDFPALVAVKN
jgi:hypothetical protein